MIVNETARLSQMVEELLDFSRMQSGHFTLQKATMDVLAELGDAVLIYMNKKIQDNIKIEYDEPEMLLSFMEIKIEFVKSLLTLSITL